MPQIIGALIVAAAMGVTSKQASDKAKSAQRQEQEIEIARVQREEQAAQQLVTEKEEAQAQAKEEAKRRRVGAARTRTVRTSPLGIAGQAQIAQKTLLGV